MDFGLLSSNRSNQRITDPWAVSPFTGLRESDVVLSMAFMIQRYLQAVGYEVLLTRIQDEQPETDDLSYRTNLSNSWGADIFVSLHCNSAGSLSTQGLRGLDFTWADSGDILVTKIFNTSGQPDIKIGENGELRFSTSLTTKIDLTDMANAHARLIANQELEKQAKINAEEMKKENF
jgi:N-acetylmuramoyl-L-alanine amidase